MKSVILIMYVIFTTCYYVMIDKYGLKLVFIESIENKGKCV